MRYRLDQVEKNYASLDKKLDLANATFAKGLGDVQAQITAYQQSLARDFLTIREADERQQATNARLAETQARIEVLAKDNAARGWGMASAVFMGGIAFLGVAVTTLSNFLKPHP